MLEDGGGCTPMQETEETVAVTPLLSLLGEYCGDACFSDCILVLEGGEEVPAHRIVLAARSQVFKVMLNGYFTEADTCRLPVEGNIHEVKVLLSYIYTGKADVTSDHAIGVYLLADKYGFEWLKGECFKCINSSLREDSVFRIFSAMGHAEVRQACVGFLGGKDVDGYPRLPGFMGLGEGEFLDLLEGFRSVFSPHAELLFRVFWRWWDSREVSLSFWESLFTTPTPLIPPTHLSPATILSKLKPILPPQIYIKLLETCLLTQPTPPLDVEGLPSPLMYRVASKEVLPHILAEAALVRILKHHNGEALQFGYILSQLEGNTEYCTSPEGVWKALQILADRRYIDCDGQGFYQYRV